MRLSQNCHILKVSFVTPSNYKANLAYLPDRQIGKYGCRRGFEYSDADGTKRNRETVAREDVCSLVTCPLVTPDTRRGDMGKERPIP